MPEISMNRNTSRPARTGLLSPSSFPRNSGATALKTPATAKAQTPTMAAGGKMSVAEMLAAARAVKGGAAPAAPEAKPQAEAAPVEEAEAEVAEVVAPAAKAPVAAASASDDTPPRYRVDRTKMSVAEMIAYCRKVDAR